MLTLFRVSAAKRSHYDLPCRVLAIRCLLTVPGVHALEAGQEELIAQWVIYRIGRDGAEIDNPTACCSADVLLSGSMYTNCCGNNLTHS